MARTKKARLHHREKRSAKLHVEKHRENAIKNVQTHVSFYENIVSPFERNTGPLYPPGLTTKTTPSTICYFMELPAELRLRIYSYVLTKHETICLSQRSIMTYYQPSLLRVSTQIRKEALPVYFSSNDFMIRLSLSRFEDLTFWLKLVASKCRSKQAFRSIRFEIQSGGWEDACKAFFFFDLLRRRKLVVGSYDRLICNRKGQAGGSRLPRALTKIAAQASGIRSYGILVDRMEKVFEEFIRMCDWKLARERLGRLGEQCEELRILRT